jgi:hypothetical protein
VRVRQHLRLHARERLVCRGVGGPKLRGVAVGGSARESQLRRRRGAERGFERSRRRRRTCSNSILHSSLIVTLTETLSSSRCCIWLAGATWPAGMLTGRSIAAFFSPLTNSIGDIRPSPAKSNCASSSSHL